MSTRDERAASRAEARRRARLAARGEGPETDEPDAEAAPPPSRPNLISRIFPPAPPLPNRPDPLAGFDPTGPFRPVRERVYLLRRNPVVWIGFGALAFIGYMASNFYGTSILGLLGTFVLFGSFIAAGWFGWQRPALFGTAAAVLSYVLLAGLVTFTFAREGAGLDTFGTPAEVIGSLLFNALYQAGLGFLGGWYGGYLRRRQTQLNAQTRARR